MVTSMNSRLRLFLCFFLGALLAFQATAARDLPEGTDALVEDLMQRHGVPGLALSVIEGGRVKAIKTYGYRDVERGLPLEETTVMYGASLTKFVFAAYVMQLAEEGLVDIDVSIADLLPKPLPAYPHFVDLAGDERWRKLTLRLLLAHQTGFPNYRFWPPFSDYDPDAKLAFVFEPGERYGYSGEGYYIAQLVIEEYLGVHVGDELQARFFRSLGMERTGLTWQAHFRDNFAQGYTLEGENKGHNMRSNARAAGSMDTTLSDFSTFVAAFMRGDAVVPAARDALWSPGLAIRSKHQFPPWRTDEDPALADIQLAAAIGVETFIGPQGHGFFKGGHDEKTDNMLLCLTKQDRCALVMMNSAKGHLVIPHIIEHMLGPTGSPWGWKYSSLAE